VPAVPLAIASAASLLLLLVRPQEFGPTDRSALAEAFLQNLFLWVGLILVVGATLAHALGHTPRSADSDAGAPSASVID
jgi:hypothetical protein